MKYFITFLTFTALYCDFSLCAVHIEDLQQEVDGHDTELRILYERIHNQELIVDAVRDQILDVNTVALENKISSLEGSLKRAVADIRQLREHANESSKMLNQYKDKIAELNQNVETLHVALETLLAVLDPEGSKQYVVVSGDSLEKIARKNKTTVKALKSSNGLKNDRIFVGQKLKLR